MPGRRRTTIAGKLPAMNGITRAVVLAVAALLPGAASAAGPPRITKPVAVLVPGEKRTADVEAATAQVIALTNAARRGEGLAELATDPGLTTAASAFAAWMAGSDEYGHAADGLDPSRRATAAGYDACIVAENLSYQFLSTGFSTDDLAASLVDGWLDSAGHRANLLDRDVTDLGVAIARSPRSGRYYAVQLFGRPRALQVAFSLHNASAAPVRYSIGTSAEHLPAGTTVNHRHCRPVELVLHWPGGQPPARIDVRDGDRLQVARGAGGVFRLEAVAPASP